MKGKIHTLALVAVLLACSLFVHAQEDPDPNSPSPVILTAQNTDRVLATDTAVVGSRLPGRTKLAFETGAKTAVTIYLNTLPLMKGEDVGAFRVYLRQADGKTFELRNRDLTRVTRDVMALRFLLADVNGYRSQPEAKGDAWLFVAWRGLASNAVRIGIGQTGGKLGPAPVFDTASPPFTPEYVGYRWAGDRVRFLEQATFGPSTQSDDRLRRIGLRTWLAEQLEAPYPYIPLPNIQQMPTSPPSDCQLATAPTCYRDRYTLTPLQQWFFKEAFYGDAQLRHRAAWALSQIFVTSGVATTQSSHAIAYHKILMDGAFGDYRTLLENVTLSPTMGNYLDMVRSTKLNPNENYPREILQLFSTGLYLLNQDGTLKLDGMGNAIPTYDQNVINELSRVMTGWTFCNTAACPNAVPGIVNYKDPMVLIPANHDLGAKTLLQYPGVQNAVIPACANCTDDASIRAYAADSLRQTLDNIANHPNVGPYIGKLLIQHLVMSDPSPAYVSRVAAAFNNNGSGVRGDLKAVFRAILLDPEARGDAKTAPRYGKLREPVQLITNLARIFPAVGYNSGGPSDGALSSTTSSMGQKPFYSPTVFNYFMPDYIVPGTTILAPEFELLNMGASVKRTNFLYIFMFEGLTPNATDSLRGTSLSYDDFIQYAVNDTTGNQLLDVLNLRMMHGTLTAAQRNVILPAVQAVSQVDPMLRVKTAAYLIAVSSHYQVQK